MKIVWILQARISNLIHHKGAAGLYLELQCAGNGAFKVHRPNGIAFLEYHMRDGALLGKDDLKGLIGRIHFFVLQKLFARIVQCYVVYDQLNRNCAKTKTDREREIN